MWSRMRNHSFWRALQDRPFASALAALLLTQPIVTLAGAGLTHDALEDLVPFPMFVALNLLYFMAGLGIFCGIGRSRPNVEAAGCALAISGLAIRLFSLLVVLGPTIPVLATGMFYVFFGGACVERILQTMRGEHIVRVSEIVELNREDDDDGD